MPEFSPYKYLADLDRDTAADPLQIQHERIEAELVVFLNRFSRFCKRWRAGLVSDDVDELGSYEFTVIIRGLTERRARLFDSNWQRWRPKQSEAHDVEPA